jgi:hypothetical protein
MKKMSFFVPAAMVFIFVITACVKMPNGANSKSSQSDTPKYTVDQVIALAIPRAGIGQDDHYQWDFAAQYLPAQPNLGLTAVWRVEQTAVDDVGRNVSQVTYFHEDTGKFTYDR